MLILIATPIGNLEDLSIRAKKTLASVELIICEDTRRTKKMLQCLFQNPPQDDPQLNISMKDLPPCISFHKFNEQAQLNMVISRLLEGTHIALLSDSGTPTVCDPGQNLIKECHIQNIPVSIIPGACAFVSALAVSGFKAEKMQFVGFLPKITTERHFLLKECMTYAGVSVAYESPHRIVQTLYDITALDPTREIALVRELTKLFEEITVLPSQQIFEKINEKQAQSPIRGEITIVISAPSDTTLGHALSSSSEITDKIIQEVLSIKTKQKISLSEASNFIAKAYGIKKQKLYSACLPFLTH